MHSKIKLLLILFAIVAKNVSASELEVQVTDSKGKPLENAVIYLESKNKATKSDQVEVDIEQKNKKFNPLVTVIQVGGRVNFPNHDRVKHHVYSFSPAKNFELKLYSGVPSAPVTFDKAGIITLGCNIHDQMLAFIYVVDTPYYGKTNNLGIISFKDIPNGEYTLKTAHYASAKENAIIEQPLNLKSKEHIEVSLEINSQLLVMN